MGVVGDWEHPYKTMNPGFEAEEVKVFGEMYKKGYIYKGLKPVYWCPHDETALAEAEIEYQDDPCTTVYVKFPMHDDQGKLSHLRQVQAVLRDLDHHHLDPARQPGHRAASRRELCRGEEHRQRRDVYHGRGPDRQGDEAWRASATTRSWRPIQGAFFENMLADHPFLPKTSRLVLADYVTMDSGTGCVHTAPGFGADDYQTCKRYGMDMVVPVDDQGRHTDYAGKYAGMVVEESNPVILKDMKESGALLASEEIVHSYPHCWRCKHPIIFRATPQWFCSVDAFKDEACAACDEVRWVPGWGIDRMKSMIRERSRLVHLPPAPVGPAHPCGLLQGLRQARRAPTRPSPPFPSCSARKAPTPGSTRTPPISCPPAMTCPHCGGKSGFEQGDRHAGRLVRLRLHPLSPP